jgi:phage terminase large subunit-like protein
MRDRMEREQYRFPIFELGGQLKKEDRIRRLIPLFEKSRVWFPQQLTYTQHDGSLRELVRDFIEEEYAPFPVGRHDDMMDCLARITDQTLNASFPRERAESAAPYVPTPGGWLGS